MLMCHFLDVNVSVPKGLCQPVSFQRALLPQLPTCVFVEHMRRTRYCTKSVDAHAPNCKTQLQGQAPGNVYHGLCIAYPGDLAR